MHDELLTRAAPLVGVVLAGERERLDDAGSVDRLGNLVGVLGDDREQVGEQLALDGRQVRRDLSGERPVNRVGAVDRTVTGDGDRAVIGGRGRAARDRRLRARILLLSRSQAARRIVSLVRYRSPSSSLRW
jgi:hypothetical protein